MNYTQYEMETIELTDNTSMIISDDTMFECTSSVAVVNKDIDTIINKLPTMLVDLVEPGSQIAAVAAVGMIDKAWLDLCKKNIFEKAKFLSKSYMKEFEKRLYSSLLKRFCRC